ncbi:hypothetical protein FQZ97_869190 [compost metagenome]
MFAALDPDPLAEQLAKQRQLAAAEALAEGRRLGDRAVVFHQFQRPILGGPALGHEAFRTADACQRGDPLCQRQVRGGHLRTVGRQLLAHPAGGQALQACLAEGALHTLQQVDRESAMPIGETRIGLGRQPPDPCRPADPARLVVERDQALGTQQGQLLAHRHATHAQLQGQPRHGLRTIPLEQEQNPFPCASGQLGLAAGNVHRPVLPASVQTLYSKLLAIWTCSSSQGTPRAERSRCGGAP